MSQSLEALQQLKKQIEQSVIGQSHVVDCLLLALLTGNLDAAICFDLVPDIKLLKCTLLLVK